MFPLTSRLTATLAVAALLAPGAVSHWGTPATATTRVTTKVASLRPVSAAARTTTRTADDELARMSLEQRVGQMFMVGTPATSVSAATASQIGRYHVGNVMLTGRSYAGTRGPARVAARMQARALRKGLIADWEFIDELRKF